jgi:hypothetical protein
MAAVPAAPVAATAGAAGPPAAAAVVEAAASAPAAAPAAPGGPGFGQKLAGRVRSLRGDVFTWLLGAGVIILAFFVFLPVLDRAKVERRDAKIRDGDLALVRATDNLDLREKMASRSKGSPPTIEERKALSDEQERWKDEKKSLGHDLEEARLAEKLNGYWYAWGAFGGLMLVTVASVGYAASGLSTTRRVTGAILICLLVITFVGAMMGKGPAISIHP